MDESEQVLDQAIDEIADRYGYTREESLAHLLYYLADAGLLNFITPAYTT